MATNTVSVLALYCPRCGRIKIHEFSRFLLRHSAGTQLLCGCGQKQAIITGRSKAQYLLDVPCIACETSHIICIDIKEFWQGKVIKIYCPLTNLELGFCGLREDIEQTILMHQREVESVTKELAGDEEIENPQIMFEVLNKLHDIAEKDGLSCLCGGTVKAYIQTKYIELVCLHCGERKVIAARNETDLLQLMPIATIQLGLGKKAWHREN